MVSVQDSAKCFFITTSERGPGLSLTDAHRALLSSYLLNLWRGPEAVRKLIVADVRRWIELGAPEPAADALLVLRKFLSEFPEASTGITYTRESPSAPRFCERRRRRGPFGSRIRAFKTSSSEGGGPPKK